MLLKPVSLLVVHLETTQATFLRISFSFAFLLAKGNNLLEARDGLLPITPVEEARVELHVGERLVLASLDDITLALRRLESVTRELLDVARVQDLGLVLLSQLCELEWRLVLLDTLRSSIALQQAARLQFLLLEHLAELSC